MSWNPSMEDRSHIDLEHRIEDALGRQDYYVYIYKEEGETDSSVRVWEHSNSKNHLKFTDFVITDEELTRLPFDQIVNIFKLHLLFD